MGISILAWLSSLDPYWLSTPSRANMGPGLGMITRPIWKCPCINLYLLFNSKYKRQWINVIFLPKINVVSQNIKFDLVLPGVEVINLGQLSPATLLDRMVVGFTTTCAISAYHHQCCEFESRSGEVYSIQHCVINFVSDLRQVGGFLRVLCR